MLNKCIERGMVRVYMYILMYIYIVFIIIIIIMSFWINEEFTKRVLILPVYFNAETMQLFCKFEANFGVLVHVHVV